MNAHTDNLPLVDDDVFDALDVLVEMYACVHGMPAHYNCSECEGRERVR